MDKKWLWIGGGAVLLILLLASRSSTPAATVVQAPDTSAQDIADIQGRYGVAAQLINATGTLDVINAQAAAQASHDRYGILGINADYAGQSMLAGAEGAAQVGVINATGAWQSILDTIGAKRDTDLAKISGDTQVALGAQDVQKTGIITQGAVTINQQDNTTAQQANQLGYLAHLSDNNTAVAINDTTQKQETKRNAWSTAGSVITGAATIAAFLL